MNTRGTGKARLHDTTDKLTSAKHITGEHSKATNKDTNKPVLETLKR